jgi:hypothetical protein
MELFCRMMSTGLVVRVPCVAVEKKNLNSISYVHYILIFPTKRLLNHNFRLRPIGTVLLLQVWGVLSNQPAFFISHDHTRYLCVLICLLTTL